MFGPIAHGFVHGVFQGFVARFHRFNFRPQQRHTHDVGPLAGDILCAHIDGAGQIKQRAHRGGGHAVLAGPCFRNNAALAHALGQQDLAQTVVDFVGAGVIQFVPFKINLRPAQIIGDAFGMPQRAGPPHIVTKQQAELALKLIIILDLRIGRIDLVNQRHQKLGNKLTAVGAKRALNHSLKH